MTRAHWLILLLSGCAALLPGLGARTLTEHEVFAAEPAREMLAGRGWLLQPFAGEVRTKKPPGQSWLIAASLFVTRSHSAFAARLPSAVAGLGLACAVAVVAARVGTSRVGLIAGLMTITCVGVQQRARLAEADMALAFCVALANAALVPSPGCSRERIRVRALADGQSPATPQTLSIALSRNTGRGDQRRAGVFWGAVVFGFLLKGPIVLGFTVLPAVVAWAALRFGTKDRAAATALRRSAFWWPAVVTGVGLIVAWPVAAGLAHPPAVTQWKHEIIDRIRGGVGHGDEQRRDPLPAYVWLLPQATLPWCVFAVAGVGGAWRARREATSVVLLCWGVCGFLVVSAIAFKVLHYVLPAVGPVLVLSAFGFDRLLARWLRGRPPTRRVAWERAVLAGWFGAAALAGVVWASAVSAKDWGRQVRSFAGRVEQLVPAGTTVYFYHPGDNRSGEDQTAWYLYHPLRQTVALPVERPAYLICGATDAKALATERRTIVLDTAEPVVSKDGTDRNDRVLVRLD